MKNFLFHERATKLKLITFKGHVYKGNIKGKTVLVNGELKTINYKVVEVKSVTSIYDEEKDCYIKDSLALCEELVSE